MFTDPIVEEVLRAAEEYAKRFNYDVHAMPTTCESKSSSIRIASFRFPPKRPRKTKMA